MAAEHQSARLMKEHPNIDDNSRSTLAACATRASAGPSGTDAVQHHATACIFALRSLVPRNLIASSIVELVAIERAILQVCGLDCRRRHTADRFEAGA
jgi:tRNA (Thr-GGU) A37 N-methylase